MPYPRPPLSHKPQPCQGPSSSEPSQVSAGVPEPFEVSLENPRGDGVLKEKNGNMQQNCHGKVLNLSVKLRNNSQGQLRFCF